MKKLAIIGSGEFQEPLILKSKQLGCETHVFSLKNKTKGEDEADFFYDIDVLNKDEILKICKNLKIDGITTIASDITTKTVVYVAEKLGLVSNSSQCLEKSTDKYKMRKAFQEKGLLVPKFYLIQKNENIKNILDEIKELNYPIIVKPTDRAGSRGVTEVNNIKDLQSAIDYAKGESLAGNTIIEEYIEGEEYSCECISKGGKHTRLAFTKKFTTGYPNFIETGHIQPVHFDNEKKIEQIIFKALDSLEITNGASHTEFKITPNNEIKVIEVGARMAGDCIGSHLVELSTGIDYIKLVIDIALGNPIKIKPVKNISNYYGIKFICNENDYNLYEFIKKNNKNIIMAESKNIIHKNLKVTDSSSRSGWYIIRTNNKKTIQDIFFKECY